MATAADIVVNIVSKLDDKGFSDAQSKTSKFSKGLSSAAKVSTAGLLAIGGAAIIAGNAAAEDAESQALLANSLTNAAGANKAAIAATEDWISAQSRATGIADDELRPALGSLVRATGDVAKSQDALKTAMDVSAATGKPLQAVSDAMAKGFGGQTTALGRLVPGMDKAILASGDMSKIMAELGRTTGGAAAAAADTTAGKMRKMKTQMGEATEALGAGLLPVMSEFAGVLETVAVFAQKNATVFQIIIGVVAGFMAAIVALNAVVKIATTIQAAYNLIMLANPAVLIVLAIVAAVALLIVIVVVLWNKSETFRRVMIAVWTAIKTAALATWEAIKAGAKSVFSAVKSIFNALKGAVKAVVGVLTAIWRGLWKAASLYVKAYVTVAKAVFNALKSAVGFVVDKVKALWNAIRNIRVPGSIKAAFEAIRNAVGWVIDRVKDLISKIKDISVPGVIKSAFDNIRSVVSDIVGFIDRIIHGLQNLPTPNINWPDPPKWLDKVIPGSFSASAPAPALATTPRVAMLGATTGATAAPSGVVINVTGALDPEGVARQIRRVLDGHNRRAGGLGSVAL